MIISIEPIYVRASKAAQLLDLTLTEFIRLVECGILPPPKQIEKHMRWSVSDLLRIHSGEAFEEAFKW